MGWFDEVRAWLSGQRKAAAEDEGMPPAPARESMRHESGPRAGWVSVWVADFRDELDYDGYAGRDFCRDHEAKAHEGGEYAVRAAPEPLEGLLATFYEASRWRDAVLEVARAQGVTEASCVYVRAHYHHAPARVAPGPMRFLASVEMKGR